MSRTREDFRQALASDRCWDAKTQAIFEARSEAVDDCILQNREELLDLCLFIEERHVRSYLEIGVWTGRLVSALHRLFNFELVAACDHGWARHYELPISLPEDVRFFAGDSDSEGYLRFRAELGPVDLVLIDGDHRYHAVRRDFEINRVFPGRFLAFHDITGANRYTTGVRRFWQELDEGYTLELVRPHTEIDSEASTMGIGIWSAQKELSFTRR